MEGWELETLLLLNRVTCLLYQTASAPTLRQGECASSPPNPSPHPIESPGTPGLAQAWRRTRESAASRGQASQLPDRQGHPTEVGIKGQEGRGRGCSQGLAARNHPLLTHESQATPRPASQQTPCSSPGPTPSRQPHRGLSTASGVSQSPSSPIPAGQMTPQFFEELFYLFFGCTAWLTGSSFPDKGLNPGPGQ